MNLTAGELDCLVVLWEGEQEGVSGMRLSQIRGCIIERRALNGEPAPALTTVSTYLRNALHKGLLEEVRIKSDGEIVRIPQKSGRGVLSGVRSPNTAYRATVAPKDVFQETLTTIANAYPEEQRLFLLVHVAEALSIPTSVTSQIKKWVQKKMS